MHSGAGGGSLFAAVKSARVTCGRRLRSHGSGLGCGRGSSNDEGGGGGRGGGEGGSGDGSCGSGGGVGGGGGGSRDAKDVWYADEHPLKIPTEQMQDELMRRQDAKRRLEGYRKLQLEHLKRQRQGECMDGQSPPVRPKVKQPRIWWTERDEPYEQGRWTKAIDNEAVLINNWRTKHLKGASLAAALARPRNSIINDDKDRGHKILQAGTTYVRRHNRMGYCTYAKRDLEKNEIVTVYAGDRYGSGVLERHNTDLDCDTHKISLRHRAAMPSYFTGINGAVINNLDAEGGSRYNLQYYIRNGCGSLLNSNSDRKCNCKVVVEYSNYANEKIDYHVDDEYCSQEVPLDSRVLFDPSPCFARCMRDSL